MRPGWPGNRGRGRHARRARTLAGHTIWVVSAAMAIICAIVVMTPTGGAVRLAARMADAVGSPPLHAPAAPPTLIDGRSFNGTRAVGALFTVSGGQLRRHFCTASVVDSPAGDLVITAAHCVSRMAPAQIAFVPGYRSGVAPYGVWRPRSRRRLPRGPPRRPQRPDPGPDRRRAAGHRLARPGLGRRHRLPGRDGTPHHLREREQAARRARDGVRLRGLHRRHQRRSLPRPGGPQQRRWDRDRRDRRIRAGREHRIGVLLPRVRPRRPGALPGRDRPGLISGAAGASSSRPVAGPRDGQVRVDRVSRRGDAHEDLPGNRSGLSREVPMCGVILRASGNPEQATARAYAQPSTLVRAAADHPGCPARMTEATMKRAHRRIGLGATLTLALAGLLAAAPAVASAAPQAPNACAPQVQGPARVGPIAGIVPAVPATGGCQTQSASPAQSSSPAQSASPAQGAGDPAIGTPPLIFHGGAVMGTRSTGPVVVTPVFWNPAGHPIAGAYKRIIDTYLAGVAAASGQHTNVFSTLNEYYGSNGNIRYRIRLGAPVNDRNPLPADGCTLDPLDTSGIYADNSGYNAGSTTTADNFCTINHQPSAAYCAYHSQAPSGTVYANLAFPIYQSPV